MDWLLGVILRKAVKCFSFDFLRVMTSEVLPLDLSTVSRRSLPGQECQRTVTGGFELAVRPVRMSVETHSRSIATYILGFGVQDVLKIRNERFKMLRNCDLRKAVRWKRKTWRADGPNRIHFSVESDP